jgi:hypothetical protein
MELMKTKQKQNKNQLYQRAREGTEAEREKQGITTKTFHQVAWRAFKVMYNISIYLYIDDLYCVYLMFTQLVALSSSALPPYPTLTLVFEQCIKRGSHPMQIFSIIAAT